MGEGGILPVAPAVGNAVYAAIGKRLQVVPLRSDVIWQAMKNDADLAAKNTKDVK
jgi:CO/xanthine dehydrogenase Mo-binding subunit